MRNKLARKVNAFAIVILFIGICNIPISRSVEINKQIGVLGTEKGNTLYVGGSGGENYSTIQEAIDASVNGDIVFVYEYSSPYEENIRINKQISVIGENRDTTIINGVSGQDHVVRISSKNAEINGFTIAGEAGGQDGIVVYPLMEDSSIINNVVKDCSYGILLQATSTHITISNNLISNNEFEGLIIKESDRNVISSNIIEKNGDFGIVIDTISNQNEIIDNTVQDNFAGLRLTAGSSQNTVSGNNILTNGREGIFIEGVLTKTNEIIGNNITGNNAGIKITSSGKNLITQNNIKENNIEGVYLVFSNENIIETNNFIDNRKNARYIISFRNTWDKNYWDDWIGIKIDIPLFKMFPKTIHGLILSNYDLNPQEEPYTF